jgi:hypothetical protein
VKVVGKRRDRPSGLADAADLQRLAIGLRPSPALVPRGVYRFSSFEEADRWMIETMARTSVSRSSRTSSGSARR